MQAHQVVCGALIRCFWGCWERLPFLFFVCTAPGFSFGFGPASACRSLEGVCSPPRQDGVKGAAASGALAHPGQGEGGVRRRRGEPAAAEASWRCSSLRRAVRSPVEVVPGSRSLAVAGCTGSQEGRCGEWPVLAHSLLGGGSSSLSVSCPSLGSALIATARARLWSSFKRLSESPLLAYRETKRQEKVSCLFGSCRLFPGLPPG